MKFQICIHFCKFINNILHIDVDLLLVKYSHSEIVYLWNIGGQNQKAYEGIVKINLKRSETLRKIYALSCFV